MKNQADFGTRSQQTYQEIIRKLDRLDLMLSITAAVIWGFAITFIGLSLVDILI